MSHLPGNTDAALQQLTIIDDTGTNTLPNCNIYNNSIFIIFIIMPVLGQGTCIGILF